MDFDLRRARFLRATRACLEDAAALRQQLGMLQADPWAADATSQLLDSMGMLEDAQGRLSDLVTVLSGQLEQALTSQSRSASASMAVESTSCLSGRTWQGASSMGEQSHGSPQQLAKAPPGGPRLSTPITGLFKAPPAEVPGYFDTRASTDIPPMPTRPTPQDWLTSPAETRPTQLYTPVQLPVKAPPATALKPFMYTTTGQTPVRAPPQLPETFVHPYVHEQRPRSARRSRSSASAATPPMPTRQVLPYGSTSDTALARDGVPVYVEDQNPGWKIVIGDIPYGTTAAQVAPTESGTMTVTAVSVAMLILTCLLWLFQCE